MNFLEMIGFITICIFVLIGLLTISEKVIDYCSRKYNFYTNLIEYAWYRKGYKQWLKKVKRQDENKNY
jgi:hypothetical protein